MGESKNEWAIAPVIQVMTDKAVEGTVLTNAIAALGELKAEESVPYIVDILAVERGMDLAIRKESFRALAVIAYVDGLLEKLR